MSFFGVMGNTDAKKRILEEIFLLVYKTHINYTESYQLPVSYRKWFVNRLIKELTPEKPVQQSKIPGRKQS